MGEPRDARLEARHYSHAADEVAQEMSVGALFKYRSMALRDKNRGMLLIYHINEHDGILPGAPPPGFVEFPHLIFHNLRSSRDIPYRGSIRFLPWSPEHIVEG